MHTSQRLLCERSTSLAPAGLPEKKHAAASAAADSLRLFVVSDKPDGSSLRRDIIDCIIDYII